MNPADWGALEWGVTIAIFVVIFIVTRTGKGFKGMFHGGSEKEDDTESR